ncbi:MAG: hypothetical protein GOMPHAMPRED_006166 [Gomphillus americanus]|uniref:Coupling of ubiquitin conjugation to ER degradation protein 1 n=1 Tax=Gomphillus americanus TaxID=1940652 RepID=A0A8H3ET57_9LECA|nr:MAG: hypothetical protein GOMPHAMPRED_006166 [Gomphillus americanus]
MSETVSLPSILIAVAIIYFGVRYFFLAPAAPSGRRSNVFPGARHIDIEKVNQISQMFPQVDRRAIAWELSRNGSSVPATTERILSGRPLDTPPPSFHPPNLTPVSSSSSVRGPSTATLPKGQDLISRYNLTSKLKTIEDEAVPEGATISKGWAATKSERAALFTKRREEMILNARKRMEDAARREAKGKGKASE